MFIYAIFILSVLSVRSIGADDVWLEPNAWEIHSPSPNTCPVCDIPDVSNEIGITTMFYKNMIAQLFNRDNLKINPKNGHLERTLILSLTPAQLKIIENASDIRDFNTAVMAIVTSAKEPDIEQSTPKKNTSSFWWLIVSIWEFVYSISTGLVRSFSYINFYNSEARFAMFVCAIMLLIWFIHKRYNKNLIVIVIVSFIMVGYFCTYIECNKKLESEDVIQFIEETEPDEPNYFSKILGKLFKSSKKDAIIEKIKKESKVKLGFCRPDDVALMYFNQIFFNQLQVIVEKMVESMENIRNTIPWPYNYMGMIALPFLFMSLLPLLFQNIFNPNSWHKFFSSGAKHHQTMEMINNNGDRLSGDNLKMFFEVLKNKTESEEKPSNSAVEDVKDLPQAITAKLDDSLCPENISEDKAVVRMEDVLEETESKKES